MEQGMFFQLQAQMAELIGTVTLDITNQNATAMVSWDEINSKMNTPTFQLVTNNYQGSCDDVLPVELTSFTAKLPE